jgi:hypothetical protein
MKAFLFACVAALFMPLVACSTLAVKGQSQITYSCAAATTAIQTLTVFRSKLSDNDIKAVNNALMVITPVCSAPVAPTYSEAVVVELNASILILQSEVSKYK